MNSMTGYGHAEGIIEGIGIAVDVKSVNGKHLDVVTRMPRELNGLDVPIKKKVKNVLCRGRVEISIGLTAQSGDQYELNPLLVENYVTLASAAASAGVGGQLDLSTLLQLPGVVETRRVEWTEASTRDELLALIGTALDQVCEARRREGISVREDLLRHLATLEGVVAGIAAGADGLPEHYRDKLRRRIESFGAEESVDPNRLAQELIFYSEKADISEELSRLRHHTERFREHLDSDGENGLGKTLDFLCQEMNREMNTVLSKSQAVEISDLGVTGKTTIERLREQVQNVE